MLSVHANLTIYMKYISSRKWQQTMQTKTKIKQVRQLPGLAYIPTCRSPSPQIVYNTAHHRASGSPVSLLHRANDRGTGCRFALPKFFHFLARGANPWAKVHQKGRWPGGLRDLPSCKISSLYAIPRWRYPLPKILRTNRKTNSNRYIPSMPIGMWG